MMAATTPSEPRIMAVIELGSTSIRMMIAQPRRNGKTKVLDSLQQAVSLGRDTFTTGTIGRSTTEACVNAVRSFCRVMREYGITHAEQIRAIASSAVREASNRNAFIDRILVATGIHVDVIEEAEVNRLTYRAVRPVLGRQPFFRRADTLVIEVGGGSTEALMFHCGKVTSSHMYTLGSLRLAKTLEEYAVSRQRGWDIMRETIDQTIDQIRTGIMPVASLLMLALGAEARFAVSVLRPEWDRRSLVPVTTAELENLTEQIAGMSTDDLVRRYHLSYEDTETLRPALLIYTRLARALRLRRVFVAEVNLRSGLLAEMGTGGNWTAEFKKQIINSANDIAHRCQADPVHARHVCAYALDLFSFIRKRHDLNTRDEMILTVAAMLHETGRFINARAHHKHSCYLIQNSDVFGLGSTEIQMAGLVARYHRRTTPKPTHTPYMQLAREHRLTVSKLAAILRVANALDCLKDRRKIPLKFKESDGTLAVITDAFINLPLIQRRVNDRADLFEQIYGMRVVVRQKMKETSS